MPVEIAYPGVHVEELNPGRSIDGVPTSTAAFVGEATLGPVEVPTPIDSFAGFQRGFGGLSAGSTLAFAVKQFFGNGGRNAVIVRTAPSGAEGALAALEATAFNLLCVPPPPGGVDLPETIRAAAAALCRRRHALYIVDPSIAWTRASDAARGLEAFLPQRGAESALYFPYLRGADPLAIGKTRLFAPCGAVAGLVARTDMQRGVWKAPAGIEAGLQGGLVPAIPLGNGDSEQLNPLGINAIRTFAPASTVVWGARTLARADRGESDYKYVPVRRFAAFIEESVSRGLQAVVFEPNTEATWARIRQAVGNFMNDLFRQGAMAGRTAREAYLVKCDVETTTAADVAAGRANLLVGFAPLKPAEFVMLRFGLEIRGDGP